MTRSIIRITSKAKDPQGATNGQSVHYAPITVHIHSPPKSKHKKEQATISKNKQNSKSKNKNAKSKPKESAKKSLPSVVAPPLTQNSLFDNHLSTNPYPSYSTMVQQPTTTPPHYGYVTHNFGYYHPQNQKPITQNPNAHPFQQDPNVLKSVQKREPSFGDSNFQPITNRFPTKVGIQQASNVASLRKATAETPHQHALVSKKAPMNAALPRQPLRSVENKNTDPLSKKCSIPSSKMPVVQNKEQRGFEESKRKIESVQSLIKDAEQISKRIDQLAEQSARRKQSDVLNEILALNKKQKTAMAAIIQHIQALSMLLQK